MTEVREGKNINYKAYENKEELKIKDLIGKITILKQGVVIERQKNADLEKEMKNMKELNDNLEKLLDEKENNIILLSKDKYELQSKLEIEKSKLEAANNNSGSSIMNLFRRQTTSANNNNLDQENKRLLNENVEIKKELETLKLKFEESCQDFDKCKNEYQNLINLQLEKIKKFDINIADKNSQYEEINKKLTQMYENWKAIDVERVKLENKNSELLKDLKQKEEKIYQYEILIVEKY